MMIRIKLLLASVGLIITAIAASWFGGRKSAAADIKAQNTARRLEAVKEAEDVRDEVEALDRDALKRRAAVWVRDNKR